jgi:hypothetical protein
MAVVGEAAGDSDAVRKTAGPRPPRRRPDGRPYARDGRHRGHRPITETGRRSRVIVLAGVGGGPLPVKGGTEARNSSG